LIPDKELLDEEFFENLEKLIPSYELAEIKRECGED
jgi:hypothetical protein